MVAVSSSSWQPLRVSLPCLEVTLPPMSVDEAGAVLAERVTPSAVFIAARDLALDAVVEVGVWLDVVVRAGDGSVLVAFRGVSAWRYTAERLPPGREAGLGIVVRLEDRALLAPFLDRPNSGSRARIPGERILARHGGEHGALPSVLTEPLAAEGGAPAAPSDDVFASVGDLTGSGRTPLYDRLAVLRNGLSSAPDGGDDTIDATVVAGLPTDDHAVLTHATAPSPAMLEPFDGSLEPASEMSGMTDEGSAPSASPVFERAFERQPTDVDLLASLSGQDLVSLEQAAANPALTAVSVVSEELSLVEAELVPDDADPFVDESECRDVPAPDAWPTTETPLPPGRVGVAFTAGNKGVTAVEPFAWAANGTKRAGRPDVVDDPRDTDVFAAPKFVRADVEDPFAPRITDPRLSVDNVIARAVRAAHLHVDLDVGGVFDSAEPTRDGSPVAGDDASTGSGDASSTSSEDTGDGPPP
jgi:hypothetical protein